MSVIVEAERVGGAVPSTIPVRVPYVDGLRAVAVLTVLFFHADKYSPTAALQRDRVAHHLGALHDPLMLGYHGVDLFFVLSGFCLAFPTLERLKRSGRSDFNIATYLTRRFVRILPPYEIALAVFVVLLLARAALGSPAPADMLQPLDLGNVLRDAFLLDRNTVHVNQSFWTLALEFRWYFVFPLVLALWVRVPRAFLALVGACMFASYFTHASSADIGYLPAFMLGIVAADIDLHRPSIARYAPIVFVVALVAAVLVPLPDGVPVSALWQIAIFAFVVLSSHVGWLRALLSLRFMSSIGLWSYSIYLIHQPVVAFLAKPVDTVVPNPWIAVSLLGAAGIAAGFLFWWLVERPFTGGNVRNGLENVLRPAIARGFAFLRIPESTVMRAE